MLALVCSRLANYVVAVSQERSWRHIVSFALVAVITVFIVLELEYPRNGFLHMYQYDEALVELRQTMQ